MALSFFALILLAVFGLFVVGGIAALCNKKTRWLGYLLLLLPAGLLSVLTLRVGLDFGVIGTPRWTVFMIPIMGIAVVGVIVMLVALLANQRTRPIGLALLAVPPILGVLLVMGLFVSIPAPIHQHTANATVVDIAQVREIPIPSSPKKQHNTPKAIPVPGKSAKPDSKKTAKPRAGASRDKSGRVFEALGTALGKTWGDLQSAKAKRSAAAHEILPAKPSSLKKTPEKKKTPPNKTADKTKKKSAEDDEPDSDKTEQIGKIVKILSVAVQKELPENIEIDQFTVLRALGTLVGRMIASEQQAELETPKPTAVAAAAAKSEVSKDTKKTSAVAVSAKKAGTSNDKRPPDGKTATAPAKPAVNKKSTSPAKNQPAKNRPDWVESQPQRSGDGYQMVFMVGPYTTRLECDQAINEQLAKAVREYAELYLGRDAAGKATLSPSFLRDHVIQEQLEEPYQSSVGKMVQVHVRLLFDARTNTELKASYRRATIEERLWAAGLGLGVILILMAGCFAVLKFDESTEGAYRGRMVFALFFTVVMMAAVLGTKLLISWRPAAAPPSANQIQDISADTGTTRPATTYSSSDVADADKATAPIGVRAKHARHARGSFHQPSGLLIVAPLLFLMLGMLFFRKTRKIALILLSLGVVLAAGALVLVV